MERPIIESWFWSPRGDCTEIRNQDTARSAINNGFTRLTEEERMRFKPGMYHPAHDQGEGHIGNVAAPQKDPPHAVPAHGIRVIKI